MKRLLLVRHATAQAKRTDQNDHDRRLSRSGQREAEELARSLIEETATPPSVIATSDAPRARETAETLRQILAPDTPMTIREGLYLAPPARLQQEIHHLPTDTNKALLVGHNPGIMLCATQLAGPNSNLAALQQLAGGFPTAGLAELESTADEWNQITLENTRLVRLVLPARKRNID